MFESCLKVWGPVRGRESGVLSADPGSCLRVWGLVQGSEVPFFMYALFFLTSFHSLKINLYSIKYFFIFTTFFHDIKICFYSVKIYLHSIRNIFIIYILFFRSSKIFFYHINLSFNTFLESMSGLPFVFTKVKIFFSACESNNDTRENIFRRIIEYCAIKAK